MNNRRKLSIPTQWTRHQSNNSRYQHKFAQQHNTAVHVLNSIITKLTAKHNQLYKQYQQKQQHSIRLLHAKTIELEKRKREAQTVEQRNKIVSEIMDMQNEIVTNIETKDIADRTRINNFYRANTGKCKPVTFLCTKESKNNRDIGHLTLTDGQN